MCLFILEHELKSTYGFALISSPEMRYINMKDEINTSSVLFSGKNVINKFLKKSLIKKVLYIQNAAKPLYVLLCL